MPNSSTQINISTFNMTSYPNYFFQKENSYNSKQTKTVTAAIFIYMVNLSKITANYDKIKNKEKNTWENYLRRSNLDFSQQKKVQSRKLQSIFVQNKKMHKTI